MSKIEYSTGKKHLLTGEIKKLSELLEYVEKTPFSRDIRTTPERFNRLLANPIKFRMDDIYNMAQMLDVDHKLIFELVHNEYLAKLEEARRKKKRK